MHLHFHYAVKYKQTNVNSQSKESRISHNEVAAVCIKQRKSFRVHAVISTDKAL